MTTTTDWMDRHLAAASADSAPIHAFVLDKAGWLEAAYDLTDGRYKGVQIIISSRAGHKECRRISSSK